MNEQERNKGERKKKWNIANKEKTMREKTQEEK